MKRILPALAAVSLLAPPVFAQTPHAANTPATTAGPSLPVPTPENVGLPPPPKVTRWEDTGMKPAEAREWQGYDFTPQEGMDWQQAGFEPVVARTWSDKGFDATEAQAWRDSARMSRSMMAELDHSDPAAWKREGFSPADRLAWWEAGFVFDDAVLLARAGMTPAQAAWHGHEKLKELRGNQAEATRSNPGTAPSAAGPGTAGKPSPVPLDAASILRVVGPFLKVGLVGLVALLAGGFAFFIYRRAQANSKLAERVRRAMPESEMPPGIKPEATPATPAQPGMRALDKRRPAREVRLFKSSTPHCVHCKSTNVRRSKMHPHKFGGINFTEYFRCKNCGRHFAIVSYTTILATAGSVVLALLIVTASFIYLFSVA